MQTLMLSCRQHREGDLCLQLFLRAMRATREAFNEYMGHLHAQAWFIHFRMCNCDSFVLGPPPFSCPGHKTLVDVHSFGDFWSWLRLGFVPLVLPGAWAHSERHIPDVPWCKVHFAKMGP